MVGEGPLGLEADAPVLEIGIEAFLRFPVAIDKTLCLVLVDVERPCLALPLEIPWHTVVYRIVQEAVADKVDKPVTRHAGSVLGEEVRMLLDEADDIVVLSLRGLETAQAVGGHDELVAMHALPVAADTDIRGIAHAIPAG